MLNSINKVATLVGLAFSFGSSHVEAQSIQKQGDLSFTTEDLSSVPAESFLAGTLVLSGAAMAFIALKRAKDLSPKKVWLYCKKESDNILTKSNDEIDVQNWLRRIVERYFSLFNNPEFIQLKQEEKCSDQNLQYTFLDQDNSLLLKQLWSKAFVVTQEYLSQFGIFDKDLPDALKNSMEIRVLETNDSLLFLLRKSNSSEMEIYLQNGFKIINQFNSVGDDSTELNSILQEMLNDSNLGTPCGCAHFIALLSWDLIRPYFILKTSGQIN